MEQADTRLKAIKTNNAQQNTRGDNDNAWGTEYGFDTSTGIGEVGHDIGLKDYCTPE
jgi:hypothetical protein